MRYNAIRFNEYMDQKSGVPRDAKKFAKFPEARAAQMSQLIPVSLLHRNVEIVQKLQPFFSDPSENHPSVSFFTGTRDQATLFQAIEKPRNVRVARDHAASDFTAGKPLR